MTRHRNPWVNKGSNNEDGESTLTRPGKSIQDASSETEQPETTTGTRQGQSAKVSRMSEESTVEPDVVAQEQRTDHSLPLQNVEIIEMSVPRDAENTRRMEGPSIYDSDGTDHVPNDEAPEVILECIKRKVPASKPAVAGPSRLAIPKNPEAAPLPVRLCEVLQAIQPKQPNNNLGDIGKGNGCPMNPACNPASVCCCYNPNTETVCASLSTIQFDFPRQDALILMNEALFGEGESPNIAIGSKVRVRMGKGTGPSLYNPPNPKDRALILQDVVNESIRRRKIKNRQLSARNPSTRRNTVTEIPVIDVDDEEVLETQRPEILFIDLEDEGICDTEADDVQILSQLIDISQDTYTASRVSGTADSKTMTQSQPEDATPNILSADGGHGDTQEDLQLPLTDADRELLDEIDISWDELFDMQDNGENWHHRTCESIYGELVNEAEKIASLGAKNKVILAESEHEEAMNVSTDDEAVLPDSDRVVVPDTGPVVIPNTQNVVFVENNPPMKENDAPLERYTMRLVEVEVCRIETRLERIPPNLIMPSKLIDMMESRSRSRYLPPVQRKVETEEFPVVDSDLDICGSVNAQEKNAQIDKIDDDADESTTSSRNSTVSSEYHPRIFVALSSTDSDEEDATKRISRLVKRNVGRPRKKSESPNKKNSSTDDDLSDLFDIRYVTQSSSKTRTKKFTKKTIDSARHFSSEDDTTGSKAINDRKSVSTPPVKRPKYNLRSKDRKDQRVPSPPSTPSEKTSSSTPSEQSTPSTSEQSSPSVPSEQSNSSPFSSASSIKSPFSKNQKKRKRLKLGAVRSERYPRRVIPIVRYSQ